MEIIPYIKHYKVVIKNIDPIEVSNEWGITLIRILQDKDCPPFVLINGNLYNRFEILRVEEFEKPRETYQQQQERMRLELEKKHWKLLPY